MAEDLVNHPSHYAGQGAIECKELMKVACLAYEGYVAVCVGNVLKYCWRCHGKETVRSLKSAKWYLDEAIKMIQDFPVSEQECLFNKSVFLYSMDIANLLTLSLAKPYPLIFSLPGVPDP